MKAIIFDGSLKIIEDHPVPEPASGEALIRVSMTGICNTDLEIMKGYAGFKGIIGHEFVGLVEMVAGRDQNLLGKRVVGEINCGCGSCSYCLSGLSRHCPQRRVLGIVNKDGAMAEYVTLPLANLHEVPENVRDEEAVFTEPLAAGFEIAEQILIRPTHKVLVLGDGKLGILVSFILSRYSADITLVGKHAGKLAVAEAAGVSTTLLAELRISKDYDLVVEATGSAGGLELALALVRPRGTVVLKSTVASGKEMNLAPAVIDEITIVGSRCGPFTPALHALSRRSIDVNPLISGIYQFHKAEEAFEKARGKESLKIIMDFR